jgi:hypothetical protein
LLKVFEESHKKFVQDNQLQHQELNTGLPKFKGQQIGPPLTYLSIGNG